MGIKNLQTINARGDVEEREHFCTVGGNVHCYNHYGMEIPKKLGVELPYDPTIPLPGLDPEKTITKRDACTPGFVAALFIIARTWKQPRSPSPDEWVQTLWYIYAMEY